MPRVDDRIEALEAKLKQLKIRKQRTETREKAIALKRSRKDELRRKILVGAVVLAKVEAGEIASTTLKQWLDPVITRDDDRALFELGESGGR